MILPTQFHVTEHRRQALLAATARAHLTTSATQGADSSRRRPFGRVGAGLRHVVASLVALAFVF